VKTFLILILIAVCSMAYSQTETAKIWTKTYNSGVKDVSMKSLADSEGNLYIAGYQSASGSVEDATTRMLLLKYNSSGELVWTKIFQSKFGLRTSAYSMVIDNSDNIYVCGMADSISLNTPRGLLVKFNTAGDTLWTKYYGQALNGYRFYSIALDNNDGVFMAATMVEAPGYAAAFSFAVKYDTSGVRLWSSANYSSMLGSFIDVNSSGDIYLGYSRTTGIQTADMYITKLDNTGFGQWTVSYNGPNQPLDYIVSMKSDPVNGDLIVAGYTAFLPYQAIELQTVKFSAGIGTVMWVKRTVGTIANAPNSMKDMIVAPNGDVYICGQFSNTGTNYDGFFIKYNGTNGNEMFRKLYNYRGGNTEEGISCITLNSSNEPLILGFRRSVKNVFVHRYSTTGGLMWKYDYNDSLETYDEAPTSIVAGENNTIFAVADQYNANIFDINAVKFDNIGVNPYTVCRTINKNTRQLDLIYDTVNVNTGNNKLVRLEVRIDSLVHPNPKDLTIMITSPHGITRELFKNSGLTSPSTGLFRTVFSDSASKTIDSGSATYTGYFTPRMPLEQYNSYVPDGNWVLTIHDAGLIDTGIVYKWCMNITYEAPVGIQTIGSEIPKSFSLSQNYPNPFNPVTNIKFSMPRSGNVSMKVYDILGRQVAELVNEFRPAGNYVVDFNAAHLSSGVYFYSIETSEFTEVKKMVLVK
jgi:subtilisin-like proprotein convertase family protein